MRTTGRPADQFRRPAIETGADGFPHQLFVIDRRAGAICERAVIACRFNRMDQKTIIDRQPQRHVMQRFARRNCAAKPIIEGVALNVRQSPFDVEQPVGPAIARPFDPSFMQSLTPRRGLRQRHDQAAGTGARIGVSRKSAIWLRRRRSTRNRKS